MLQNSNPIKVYQFIDSSKINLKTYVKRLLDLKLIICFDLEDSIKEFENTNSNNSSNLKDKVFNNIKKFLQDFSVKDFGVRVNESNTEECKNDILVLSRLINDSTHLQIFLPKVHSKDEIKIVLEYLRINSLTNYQLIPIIESQRGIYNLLEIIESVNSFISKIAFGHCDYNYDCSIFPFHHQQSKTYWDWIKIIIDKIDDDILFINSPYLLLDDDIGFQKSLNNLLKLKKYIGQITLGLKQSNICNNISDNTNLNQMENNSLHIALDSTETLEYASELLNEFIQYKVANKSFAVNPNSRKLISPQEYLSAKNFIAKKCENSI